MGQSGLQNCVFFLLIICSKFVSKSIHQLHNSIPKIQNCQTSDGGTYPLRHPCAFKRAVVVDVPTNYSPMSTWIYAPVHCFSLLYLNYLPLPNIYNLATPCVVPVCVSEADIKMIVRLSIHFFKVKVDL